MNSRKIFLLIAFLSLLPFPKLLALEFGIPSGEPPVEVNNIKLNIIDFQPGTVFKGKTLLKDPMFAGWYKSPVNHGWVDVVQGVSESWSFENNSFKTKYGFFETPNESQFAVQNVIALSLGAEADLVSQQNSASFDGQTIGDKTFSWEIGIERRKGYISPSYAGDIVSLAFSKGKYAFLIQAGNSISAVDKNRIIELARKVEKKIGVAEALDSLYSGLISFVLHQGTLHSLQVKIDEYVKHYQEGKYNTALNSMNAFLNELNAQRGKHVSEEAYQILKPLADAIISNTNLLLL